MTLVLVSDGFTILPAFVFEARPVIPIADAIRVELESIAFRDRLPKRLNLTESLK